jgi:solute carrier family 25 folate transporter 32
VAPLFAGLSPALVGSTLQFVVLMELYDPLRSRLHDAAPAATPAALPGMAAGALAGAAACVATNPVWVLKTRLQTLPATAATPPSVLAAAASIMRTEGGRAFFRGVTPSLLLVSYNMLHLPLYTTLKQQDASTFAAVAGSVTVASALTYPLQVIRTRFQAERAVGGRREYASFASVVQHVVAAEGSLLRSFYAGFGPHLVRSVASWFVKFAVAERVAQSISAE